MRLDEFRVNDEYTTAMISEFPDGDKEAEGTPIINRRTIRTSEFIEKLISLPVMNQAEYKVDHLFPPNCRYYEKHAEGHIAVIEEPPAYRTITVNRDFFSEVEALKASGKLKEYGYENWLDENTKPYQFHVALPYAVFFLAFTERYDLMGGRLYFRTQPISGFQDVLCKAPFTNISESQNICFGDIGHKGPKRSIFADVNYVISTFWASVFNQDYIYNYIDYQAVAGLCDYLTWEYYSHQDPMFIYTADWIKAKDDTVGSVIEQSKEWIFQRAARGETKFGYKTLNTLFTTQSEKEVLQVPDLDVIVEEPLLYDICQYIFLDETTQLRIGDSFQDNKGRLLYIDSFLGFKTRHDPMYIQIQREDGRIFRMRYTLATLNYVKTKVHLSRYVMEHTLPNGEVLKPGDILVLKGAYNSKIYKKIYYLRKNPAGPIEGRFGSDYYFIDSIDKDASIMDASKPEYCDIKLVKDEKYMVMRSDAFNHNPTISSAICTFDQMTTGRRSSGGLILKLTEVGGRNKGYTYNIPLQSEHGIKRIISMNEIKTLPPVFRAGRKLVYARNLNGSHGSAATMYSSETGFHVTYDVALRDAPTELYKGKLITDDTFRLESFDLDLEFTIGDKVVVSNWDDPLDMLTVKQISGFVENSDGDVIFTFVDKNENVTTKTYIEGRTRLVNIGSVRKISNVYEDLSAGMKITAKQTKISMFPKKDTNIIIGFLIDTGGPEPLVLCSNACTLWYSDVMTKFDIIPMGDDAWAAKVHAPITPSKMRIQAGDLLKSREEYYGRHGYMTFKPRESKGIRAANLTHFTGSEESSMFDKHFTSTVVFDGFPNPRLTSRQETSKGFVNGFPNFHGMVTMTHYAHSPYFYHNDPRSLLNVPDSSE